MKKTNKFMALFIVLAMLASMMSFFTVTVSADATAASIEVSEADEDLAVKLKTLGVITGEFNLSNYVTRGEMASIAAKYAGIPASASAQVFNDVGPDHPYYDAIGALYNMGIVTGHADGNFGPDDFVTYDQALVYVINAIGHKPFAEREGGYPTGYHRIAIKHGMLSNLSMKKGTDYATLADIYRILDEGLTAAAVETSYYGDGSIRYNLSDTDTFLSNVYNIRQYRGVITGIPGTRLTSIADDIKEDQIEINGKKYELYGYPEFSMLGYCVDFYVNADDPDIILHVEETKRRNELLRIDADDLDKAKTTETRVYYHDDNDREYHIDLDLNFNMIYNNQYYDMYGVLSRALPDNGYIEVLDNNGDGAYDILFIFTYYNVFVENISSDCTSIRDKISGTKLDLSDEKQVVNVYYNGSRRLSPDSIMVGDILSIVESKNAPKTKNVYIARNAVSGRIEGIDTTRNSYCINGEWYKLADDTYAANLSLGLEAIFYLDINDEIAFHSLDMTNRKGTTAVMTGIDYKLSLAGNAITIRVYTQDGNMEYLELNNNVKVNGNRYDISDRSKAEIVLGAIANDRTGGEYNVNSAYAISYVTNADDKVVALDLGGEGGAGNLNVIVSKDDTNILLMRNYNILQYKNGGNTERRRLNSKNSWVISVPEDGELDEIDSYKKFSFTHGYFYGPPSQSGEGKPVDDEYVVQSYDIYSFNETEIPMIDIILVRGLGGSDTGVAGTDQIGLVMDMGKAVTDIGETTVKLYMANKEYALAPEVKFPNASGEYVDISAASLLTGVTGELNTTVKLEKGMIVQYALNNDDEISALRFVSRWDNTAKANVPLFKAKTSSGSSYILGDTAGPSNLVVGTVDEFDLTSRQMFYTVADKATSYFLYQDGDDVIIYDTATGNMSVGNSADIVPGDKFVLNVDNFYTPQTVVIFR